MRMTQLVAPLDVNLSTAFSEQVLVLTKEACRVRVSNVALREDRAAAIVKGVTVAELADAT